MSAGRLARMLLPAVAGLLLIGLWEAGVRALAVPVFVLPPPSAIAGAFATDLPGLLSALGSTLEMTVLAFVAATFAGLAVAVAFTESRLIARIFLPYAVALQVTPIVAIAPLIVIWVGVDHVERAVFILATIVAFFPVLANATLGLRSADPGLVALFRLYGAGRWRTLRRLRLPAALPALLAGMKVSGGLALIGTVVAEFVAGSGEAAGLAWRIVEAGNRLQIPRMFAALILLSLTGIAIYGLLSALEWALLHRWHESARPAGD